MSVSTQTKQKKSCTIDTMYTYWREKKTSADVGIVRAQNGNGGNIFFFTHSETLLQQSLSHCKGSHKGHRFFFFIDYGSHLSYFIPHGKDGVILEISFCYVLFSA